MYDYQTLIKKLFEINLFGGMKLGLQNSLKFHQLLNEPANSFKIIHVAGTNGKGSVATKIAKGLELSGLKTGLYTSPHIASFLERIQINGNMISENDIQRLLNTLFTLKEEHQIPATFFEMTTMLMLLYFAEQKIDVAVIETGLGGRLDATNIVTPILSVITSISLDHKDILGNTIEAITLEKAGIIKNLVPIITGPKVPVNIISPIALQKNSPHIHVSNNFINFDDENSCLAKEALKILNIPDTIIENAIQVKPPCRIETIHYLNKTFILDVAHNEDGLYRLFSTLKKKYPEKPFRIIFGLSQNKDIQACVSVIKQFGNSFHLIKAKNGRAASFDELKNHFDSSVSCYENIEDAINNTLNYNDLNIICGTFFIMSEAKKALKLEVDEDFQDMNERSLKSEKNVIDGHFKCHA